MKLKSRYRNKIERLHLEITSLRFSGRQLEWGRTCVWPYYWTG